MPPITGHHPETGAVIERHPDDKEPLSALIFKVMMDEGRRMSFVRIYSGRLEVGEEAYNSTQQNRERIARIFQMHSNKRTRLDVAETGNIVAVMGLKNATTGDTLCDPDHPILLERIDAYESVISMAVEPRRNADLDKLRLTLDKFADEDPTFHVKTDPDTGQTLISGMGELHLEVIVDRLRTEYGLEVNVGQPQVVYRETVGAPSEATAVFEREIAGKDHYAAVTLRLEPLGRGKGNLFRSEVPRESLAEPLFAAIEAGVREAAFGGVLMGYPVVDVAATLVKVGLREGQSSEIACKAATMQAFFHAMRDGAAVLLEPIMQLEVIVPEEFLGGDHGRHQRPPGADHGRVGAEEPVGHHSQGAAAGSVRLLPGGADHHPGAGHFHHAVLPLRDRHRPRPLKEFTTKAQRTRRIFTVFNIQQSVSPNNPAGSAFVSCVSIFCHD